MSSNYYLHKFGGVYDGTQYFSSINSSQKVYDNTALGAIFANNYIDKVNSLDFIFNNEASNADSGEAHDFNVNGFNEFYLEYKDATGSDLLSYLNGYCDTSTLALGDMKNALSGGKYYADNTYSVDANEFSFFDTYDDELYRFTDEDGLKAAEAGANTAPDSQDVLVTNQSLKTNYESWYDSFETANATGTLYAGGFAGADIALSDFDLDFATVNSKFSTVEETKEYYQMVIDQVIDEVKQIQPMTLSEEKRIELEREIAKKQAELKTVDDALFGYGNVNGASDSSISNTTTTVDATKKNLDFSYDTFMNNIQADYDANAEHEQDRFAEVGTYDHTDDTLYGSGKTAVQKVQALADEILEQLAGNGHLYEVVGGVETQLSASDVSSGLSGKDIRIAIDMGKAQEFFEALEPSSVARNTGLEDAIAAIDAGSTVNDLSADQLSRFIFDDGRRWSDNYDFGGVANAMAMSMYLDDEDAFVDSFNMAGLVVGKYSDHASSGWVSFIDENSVQADLNNGDLVYDPDTNSYIMYGGASIGPKDFSERYMTSFTQINPYDISGDSIIQEPETEGEILDDIRDAMLTGGTLEAATTENTVSAGTETTRFIKNNDDETALVKSLSKYLEENTFIHDASESDMYNALAETTAAILEQYWVENFNEENPPDIYEYFELHLRNRLDKNAENSYSLNVTIETSDGSGGTKNVSGKLDFSLNGDTPNTIDRILESQEFAQISFQLEQRTRLEMEIFEMSTALDVSANVYNNEFMTRVGILADIVQMHEDNKSSFGNEDWLSFVGMTKRIMTLGCPDANNVFWEEYFPWFKGFYGNLPDGVSPEEMFNDDGSLNKYAMAGSGGMVDPYITSINGVDYVMGQDKDKNGVINDASEILGITDTKETLFKSLYELDSDEDGYISQQELKANNIILDAVNQDHRFNNATIDVDFVRGIDLGTVSEADGTNNIFGNFKVDLANGKKADAVQTFQNQGYFNNLFGKYVDLSFVTDAQQSTNEVESEAEAPKVIEPEKVIENKFTQISKQFKNIFSTEETTDEESIEGSDESAEATLSDGDLDTLNVEQFKILDNGDEVTIGDMIEDICWKSGVNNLTSTQRYDILDSIDVSQDSEVIERRIRAKIHSIQLA